MDELSLEFHCVLQLQDRSRNANGTFMSGWIMSSNYIFGGRLAELLRFAGVHSTCTLEGSLVQNALLTDNGRTIFQYKGWLRTWQGKLCGTTVAGRSRVMLGSCSNRPCFLRTCCLMEVHCVLQLLDGFRTVNVTATVAGG